MKYALTILLVGFCSTVVLAQQSATFHRVGDVFRGHVKMVRTERTHFIREGDELIESQATPLKLTTYSLDGLKRESISYSPNGTRRQKIIETFRPNGSRLAQIILDAKDNLISSTSYEYDSSGLPVTETRHGPDGAVYETKIIQSTSSPKKITGQTRITGNGTQVETAVNTGDENQKSWSFNKSDGRRSVDNHSRDADGNHITETLGYSSDGALTTRRVSKVDAGVTRLEATQYDAAGNILQRDLETREYDSRRNLIKLINYRWDGNLQKFQPASATYHHITYFQ